MSDFDNAIDALKKLDEGNMMAAYLTAMAEKYPERKLIRKYARSNLST
jgi:hypothetical protein